MTSWGLIYLLNANSSPTHDCPIIKLTVSLMSLRLGELESVFQDVTRGYLKQGSRREGYTLNICATKSDQRKICDQSMGKSEGWGSSKWEKKTKKLLSHITLQMAVSSAIFKRFQINILDFSQKYLLPNSKAKKLDFFLSFPHDFLSSKSPCWA